jgi:hypothetical protein
MSEIVSLILGALIGVIADLLFRQRILRFSLQIRRMIARVTKRPDPLIDKPRQLRFGSVTTDWVSLHGTGELPLQPRYLRADLIEEYVTLPRDLDALRGEARKTLEERAKNVRADVWNAERFSLVRLSPTRYGRTEQMGVIFEFKLTDYAAFLAITLKADEHGLVKDEAGNPTTIREKYFPRFDPERPNPYLTHSFGINLAVITQDQKIILTQRNAFVTNQRNCYHIPVNEGMQFPQDMDEYARPSFTRTAIRGLWEELGIDCEALGVRTKGIEFLSFGALAKANQYALLGRVKLPLSAREVEQAYYMLAKDRGMETRHELYAVDYLPDSILEFVNLHQPWTHNGLATLYYTMVRQWGYWETKQAFARHPGNWRIVASQGEQ